MVNVTIYSIHGSYGYVDLSNLLGQYWKCTRYCDLNIMIAVSMGVVITHNGSVGVTHNAIYIEFRGIQNSPICI